MRRLVFAAVAAAVLAAGAFGRPADSVTRGNAAYARRGSLGSNDYVATNVAPCSSAYALCGVGAGGVLADRSVNAVSAWGDVSLAVPTNAAAPGFARSFCVYLRVDAGKSCRLTLTGAEKMLSAVGSGILELGEGAHVLSFLELEKDVYVVDSHELTEF